MKHALLLLAFCSLLQTGNAQEPDELTKLREQYISASNRAMDPLSKKYIERLEVLKSEYARNGKPKESSYFENEILKLNAAKEAGFVGISRTPESVIPDVEAGPEGGVGEEFKELYGIWKSGDEANWRNGGRQTTFEFKPGRKMAYTHEYETSGGGKTSSTTIYEAKEENDKIIIDRKDDDRGGYKSWYEIKIPFSLEELEITNHSVHSEGNTITTYKIRRINK